MKIKLLVMMVLIAMISVLPVEAQLVVDRFSGTVDTLTEPHEDVNYSWLAEARVGRTDNIGNEASKGMVLQGMAGGPDNFEKNPLLLPVDTPLLNTFNYSTGFLDWSIAGVGSFLGPLEDVHVTQPFNEIWIIAYNRDASVGTEMRINSIIINGLGTSETITVPRTAGFHAYEGLKIKGWTGSLTDISFTAYFEDGDGVYGSDLGWVVIAIPEPSTYALLTLGIASIIFFKRKKT